jgi:Sulfotransferase family
VPYVGGRGYYLYHPLALPRIAQDLPGVRLIVMLRNPVERAYSAYKHELARGFEAASFEAALELEPERLDGEEDRLASQPGYQSHAHRHQAYLARGRYVEQLRRLFEVFPPDQVYVLDSEEFFAAPVTTYAAVLAFLGLPDWVPLGFERHNARPGSELDEALRTRLDEYFQPYDEELAELLGRPPSWRR